ncbi:MAG: ABC transporter substrate-binding protein [Lachnospiraceae bacterium]|nr:ABC transporter substrate-binding protein [Lachnospiraceae bacterium]
MRKTRKAAALLTAAAMAVVSAMPVMADEIKDLYDYETQAREIETWNILQSQLMTDTNVLTNLYDGLVEADVYGRLTPAVAESWETEDNGVTWTFHLRQGVKWVDQNANEKGEVTAQDFLTGLEWVLNFHKNDAANTSMPMEMIVGAEDYYNLTSTMDADAALALTAESPEFADTVGIKAIDDYTLQYTCLSEKPYFDTVAAYNCLYPISQAMIDEIGIDGFKAATPENIWYNGAYTCTEYIQQNTKTLTKNPLYWDTECTRFDTVTIKMVESVDVAYQLYTTGELDRVDLSESNLTMIYNNESDPYHDQLVEKLPNKKSYQFHFNYDKHNDDQSEDTNWNTAIANEAFRKCWYYGLDLGSYYKRTNAINPYKCYNNAYTMQGLIYTSDGTEYTSLVQEKLGLPAYDGETMTRLNSEKFEEYKAQAIEELTAAGVTFPIHARYFVASGNQTALDSASVLKQAFSDSFGDDFIVLDIDSYVSSLSQEVYSLRRQSFGIAGWGADYGDPQNYLGQETDDSDNAYYMVVMGHAVDNQSDELKDLYSQFTELVNKADAINDDLDARYEAYAEAEAFMLDHALIVPAYLDISWELTHVNDYSKINAMFGIQNNKYKNWETSTDGYTAEDYAEFEEIWNAGMSK